MTANVLGVGSARGFILARCGMSETERCQLDTISGRGRDIVALQSRSAHPNCAKHASIGRLRGYRI